MNTRTSVLGVRRGGGAFVRAVGVLLRPQEPRCVQGPAHLVGQVAFLDGGGLVQPPGVPRLHVAVFSSRHQQMSDSQRHGL